ncbi:diuretic hormone receptor-like isoform X1 [Anopheles albimanus]|uniref:diuretic hormone receptor-like isoform X1 n=1 Tax=Anopheles albimanus TaxID=7167 RepID=UPI00163F0FD8|nr:diuretic hormone receptor-like isoform X1 [Anopheles albimanus]XP_035787326.1 diuretic hormone receptor-like isoform X1 [Anopheles albimanus]XP_035787327.1 diuretic hormone receptor-like isoform X1 [Anopheles albimanus]XP_035787328.1 diuretic hormone receptor-like isoform X1 [Anopheles albimanus]XP_035787330.1 diuretic hormone receptor-like isoform X1 [Anopheles albimanus]XP_035787331.1 diuretic hormone receptor-like isoform X1 [Anopheles albimanus]
MAPANESALVTVPENGTQTVPGSTTVSLLEALDGVAALSLNMSTAERCRLQQQLEEELPAPDGDCPTFFDLVSCWPRTPPGTLAVLPCFSEFKGVQYDTSHNATRFCNDDGTWDNYTDYDSCQHLAQASPVPGFEPGIELPTLVYFVGYSISLAALVLAVVVLVYFKDLRCLRNTIHVNLFLTYIMSSSLWILILSLQITVKLEGAGCIVLVTLFHYFSATNFFWMLVEGLYLYMLVVQTFSGDTLRFRKYAIIGWGGPLIFVGAWAIAKPFFLSSEPDLEHPNKLEIECSWMRESHIDWIIQGPTCAVLAINLIFLLRIMWVLITKLRSANTVETRQYRKASKALLVLIPLLGITYLIVIYGPMEGVGSHIFATTRALLLSTQGFVVSLLYCFLNSEVRQTLRHHFYRWRDERNILAGKVPSSHHRRPTFSKDNSPRSRTESTRTVEYSIATMKHSCAFRD